MTVVVTKVPSYQEEITGSISGGRQGSHLPTPTSDFRAGPAREVLLHFPMETICWG